MKQTFEEALNAHLLSASRVVEHARELKAVRSLTDALQALEGRLADVEASVGQPGPLDALENRVERLEGHIEHRAWTAITERVAKLEREAVIREPAGARIGDQIWKAIEAPTKSQLDDLDRTLRGLLDGVSAGAHRAAGLVSNELERLKRDVASLEMKVAELVPRTTPDYKTVPRPASVDGRCPNVSGWGERCELEAGHLEQHCAAQVDDRPARFWPGFAQEALLDLTTLRVPCDADADSSVRIAPHGALQVEEDGCAVEVLLNPRKARLLARALTQWADGAEKGAGK